MESMPMVVIGLAVLVMIISTVALAVAAFRQSILWGLVCLFVPLGIPAFIICHWSVARTGFLTSLASLSVIVVGGMMLPKGAAQSFASLGSSTNPQDRAAELTVQIQEKRDRIYQLETSFADGSSILAKQFEELEKQRKVLTVANTAAVNQFNEQAAAYQQQNAQRKMILQEIETERLALNNLLAERSKIAAASPGSGSAGSSQRIVMYSAAWCPACKAAKQYMAQRGISYDERDVDKSPADRAEFQRLGGRGVPLILVGDKRMVGFDPQAFEKML